MATLLLQLAYGGLVAGLKAGYLSDTWPDMFGQLIPAGILSRYEPWWQNLYEALASHWIHRWLAFVVAAFALALFAQILRDRTRGRARDASFWLMLAVAGQIILGIYVVLLGVPKWFAIAHQGLGIIMFGLLIVIAHQAFNERHAAWLPG
jgi:cytochrome c oxidase assembly protein subunit 15